MEPSEHQVEGINVYGQVTPCRCSRRCLDAPASLFAWYESDGRRYRRRANVPANPEIREWLQSHQLEPPVRVRQGAGCAGLLLLRRDAVECPGWSSDVGSWPQGLR